MRNDSYTKNFENSTFKELVSEKNRLLEMMNDFEDKKLEDEFKTISSDEKKGYAECCRDLSLILDLLKDNIEKDDVTYSSRRCLTKTLLDMDENDRAKALDELKK